MRMLDMLRAMDAYVGDQDDGDAAQDAVTCPRCGAPVESDALDKQTLPDGSLMWPAPMCQPFCRACLLAGLRRLDAELKRQPGEDGDA